MLTAHAGAAGKTIGMGGLPPGGATNGSSGSMTATDFCYWLQGAIEIGGLQAPSAEQRDAILRQLLAVWPHDVFTLSSALLLRFYALPEAFATVREELQKVFLHDIDPSYDGDQEFLQQLHEGKTLREEP
jgi:hypothetical protein